MLTILASKHLRRWPYAAGFALWGVWIVIAAGMAVHSGLCCEDDSYFALTAKSIATGHGYAAYYAGSTSNQVPVPFDPYIGTGPGLMLPFAWLLRLFGIHEVIPGLATVLVWGNMTTLLLALIARRVAGPAFLWGVGLFVLANAALFHRESFQWYTLLGEIPAAAYLLLGHWLAAMGRVNRGNLLLAGLFIGLAVQTKYLAAAVCAGAAVIIAVRLIGERRQSRPVAALAAMFLLGCAVPLLLFEGYKMASLGADGYCNNIVQNIAAVKDCAVDDAQPFSAKVLQQRGDDFAREFTPYLAKFLLWVAAIVLAFRARMSTEWSLLLAGLLISVCVSASYWVFCSVGWTRYLVIAVATGCFAMSVPAFALENVKRKLYYTLLVAGFLVIGGGRPIDYWIHALPFRPSAARVARAALVGKIKELQKQGETRFIARDMDECSDLDFMLDGVTTFRALNQPEVRETVVGTPGRKFVVINRRFGVHTRTGAVVDEENDAEVELNEKIVRTLFSADTYELFETSGPLPEGVRVAKKTPAAFIKATPVIDVTGTPAGTTTISWDTIDGSVGDVVVYQSGQPEHLFASGERGSEEANWISIGVNYEFRLYQHDSHKLLSTVVVENKAATK